MMNACASPSGLGCAAYAIGMPELRAIAEQALEPSCSCGRGDDQHVADAGQHQRRQRVIHHRLVVDRQQLLADALVSGCRRDPDPPARMMPDHSADIASGIDAPSPRRWRS